jgi:hypothetical protein
LITNGSELFSWGRKKKYKIVIRKTRGNIDTKMFGCEGEAMAKII